MPSPPTLHLPSTSGRTDKLPGCGCCQHCQCSGRCGAGRTTSPEPSPSVSRSNSPLSRSASSRGARSENDRVVENKQDDHYHALESALHPSDAISLPQKLKKYVAASDDDERWTRDRSDNKNAKASREPSPERKLTQQEEYEAGYAAHSRRHHHHRREKSNGEIEKQPSDDEREDQDRLKKERNRRKEAARNHVETVEVDAKNDTARGEVTESKINERRREIEHSSSNGSHLSAQSDKQEVNFDKYSHSVDYLPSSNAARPRREIIKEIRALVREAAIIPSASNNGNLSTLASLCSATLTQTDVTKGRSPALPLFDGGGTSSGTESSLSSLKVIRKLVVHMPTEYGLMLHFLDWSRRNDRNEPLVAYRLQDGEKGPIEKRAGGGSLFGRKPEAGGRDWLQESHDTGTKLAARLALAVGVKGPPLYQIDLKRRRVDKFILSSVDDREVQFVDEPFYGSYTDYRHLYFSTPTGRTMKWHVVEPDRLMRLYGRGSDDYDIVYAEARMHRGEGKKNRGAKEVQLVFFDPNDPNQPRRSSSRKEGGKIDEAEIDIAHLCATWWCARQTFDESRLVEAHAEVAFIENIEKAFEVDLLAGA